jgi:hypothetical protein
VVSPECGALCLKHESAFASISRRLADLPDWDNQFPDPPKLETPPHLSRRPASLSIKQLYYQNLRRIGAVCFEHSLDRELSGTFRAAIVGVVDL